MAFALVQSATNHSAGNSATLAVTVSAITTGNYLIAAVAVGNGVFPIYPTVGSGSVEWYMLTQASGVTVPLGILVGRIITGGTTTVTLRGSAAAAISGIVLEFSAGGMLIPDKSIGTNGTATAISTGNAAATSVATELWWGATSCRNDTVSTQLINGAAPDNSYFDVTTYNASTADRGVGLAYKIVAATGTPTPGYSATNSQTSVWNALFWSLRQEQAAGGGMRLAGHGGLAA